MKRRQFVKLGFSSLLAAPVILSRGGLVYADAHASPVISVYDGLATKLRFQEGSKVNSDGVIVDKVLYHDIIHARVANMVDKAVKKMTGQQETGKAWESLFPAGHPNRSTRIGIKLNFSYGDWQNDEENDWSKLYCPFGPKSAITDAIVTGLSQMMDGTFPVENITFVERMYSVGSRRLYPLIQGYRPVVQDKDGIFRDVRDGSFNMHWIYAANPLELPEEAPHFLAAPDYPEPYKAPQRIYKAVYDNDFLINYAIAKDHREAGITGAMKNNYGCTDNPVGTHGSEWNKENSPFAGTRLCVPAFYKNIDLQAPFILNILDALTGVYQGGPLSGKVFHANTLAVSRDPVALDAYLLQMINRARGENGFSLIGTSDGRTPEGHPHASFLRVASENHEMGSLSMDNLQTYDLSSNPTAQDLPVMEKSISRISEIRRSDDAYKLHVFLDQSKRNHKIESRIEDERGKVIKSFATTSTVSSSAVLEWDHRNDDKVSVRDGVYTWYVAVDGRLHSGTINDFQS
jgi:hypothetical protein